ncbi:Protein AIR1 [Yarrowia sp. C11]|nr:Protein AIR1 [Yarrowia sp. E02]KAG5369748.1 Protein AIR1 [Yarrowia sp. C11]
MSSDEEDTSDLFFMDTEASAPAYTVLSDSEDKPASSKPLETFQSVGVDDVDDGEDQLIEMRGDGRYFGREEEQGPTCRTCHKRGHISADCKVLRCFTCGALEDHDTADCTMLRKCSNCGESGHLRAECTASKRTIFCWRCDSRIHTEDKCHLIWRDYVKDRRGPHGTNCVFCYHCGGQGHYGDECTDTRNMTLRFKEPSAFSGGNLPRKGRYDIQKRYFDDLEREKSRSYRGGDSYSGGSNYNRNDGNRGNSGNYGGGRDLRREKRERERKESKNRRKAEKRGGGQGGQGMMPKPQSSGYIPSKSQYGPVANDDYSFRPKLKQNHDHSDMFNRNRMDMPQPTRSGHYNK